MIEPGKPTSVWWWPTPREGEVVPDYPPSDITSCIASGSFDDGLEELLDEAGNPPLTPWQREIVSRSYQLVANGNVYLPSRRREWNRRMNRRYRQRQLARQRRRR